MNRGELSALFHEMIKFENVVGVGRGHKWVRGENTGRTASIVLVRQKVDRSDLKRAAIIPRK